MQPNSGEMSSKCSPILEKCPFGQACFRQAIEHFQEFDHDHLGSMEMLAVGNTPATGQPCWYGVDCFRTNAEHRAKFAHPNTTGDVMPSTSNDTGPRLPAVATTSLDPPAPSQPSSAKRPAESSAANAVDDAPRAKTPRADDRLPPSSTGVYMTKVNASSHNTNCVSLADIINAHDGLSHSIHFSFMVDIGWLLRQYPVTTRHTPMHVIVGEKMGTTPGVLRQMIDLLGCGDSVTVSGASLPLAYGTHHTKMSILYYEAEKRLRIVIGTANLVADDWDKKTQGVYISPLLPAMAVKPETASPVQSYLLNYLSRYATGVVPAKWIERIRAADFDAMKNISLVASVPGAHRVSTDDATQWGIERARQLLAKVDVPDDWPLMAQFSSIGSLGANKKWLNEQLTSSLCPMLPPSDAIKLIYPSVSNVRESYDGYEGSGSLPYRMTTHARQTYLNEMMHQWKSDRSGRTRALPHTKTYTRVSSDGRRMKWFLLTSANLSKAAWGDRVGGRQELTIRSYELGVLLTADAMKVDTLPIDELLPFDLPLSKYGTADAPWTSDTKQMAKDVHGNQYTC